MNAIVNQVRPTIRWLTIPLLVALAACGGGSKNSLEETQASASVVVGGGATGNTDGIVAGGSVVGSTGGTGDMTGGNTVGTTDGSAGGSTSGSTGGTSDTSGGSNGGTPTGNGACTGTTHTLNKIAVRTANDDVSVPAGYSEQFLAVGYYDDCTQADVTSNVTWTSDTGAVVFDPLRPAGVATANSLGATNIRAALAGINSAPYAFFVTDAVLVSIDVLPGVNPGDSGYALAPYITIAKGTSAFFTAWASYSDGSQLDVTNSMDWSSSAPAAITFSYGPGIATGVLPVVNAQITASLRSDSSIVCPTGVTCSDTALLTVTGANLVSITVTSSDGTSSLVSLPPAPYAAQFVATGHFDDGSTQDLTIDPALVWSVGTGNGASFNQPGLLATGNAGNAPVTATMNGISGTISVVVTDAHITGITITPASSTLPVGTGVQLTAFAQYSDGNSYAITSGVVAWSASATTVQVSASGYATAIAVGTANVTAQLPGYDLPAGTATVTVVNAPLDHIIVVGTRNSTDALADGAVVVKGTRLPLFATGFYDFGVNGVPDLRQYDVTGQCRWKTSANTIAVVQKTKNGAMVSGLGVGSATVTARKGQRTMTDTVAVNVQ